MHIINLKITGIFFTHSLHSREFSEHIPFNHVMIDKPYPHIGPPILSCLSPSFLAPILWFSNF